MERRYWREYLQKEKPFHEKKEKTGRIEHENRGKEIWKEIELSGRS